MESITVNKKDYQLNFGIRFSSKLSEKYYLDQEMGDTGRKMKFGIGIQLAVPYLEMASPDAVFNVIKCGLAKHKIQPTDDDLEEAIEELAIDKGGFDVIAEELIETLKATGFYNKAFTEMDQATENQAKA